MSRPGAGTHFSGSTRSEHGRERGGSGPRGGSACLDRHRPRHRGRRREDPANPGPRQRRSLPSGAGGNHGLVPPGMDPAHWRRRAEREGFPRQDRKSRGRPVPGRRPGRHRVGGITALVGQQPPDRRGDRGMSPFPAFPGATGVGPQFSGCNAGPARSASASFRSFCASSFRAQFGFCDVSRN